MELKSSITTFFLLFLLFATPFCSLGGLPELDSEVYEIDYRGPETHSSIPPPDHSHGRGKPVIRHESAVVPPESKATGRKNGKKVHG
ncbi:hypothetical protein WN944_003739 [Citrus x changshan-huyou]|uniref:Transmembrane protein n=2 Tax=Citrus TaxID=2706 RepID=A0A067D620_CITSI|nr:hypothetical protein CISIN_1g034723mg [Citrus sinensis]